MSCIAARGLYNTNIYQSLDAGNPKGGHKSQVPHRKGGNSWGGTLCELPAPNTPSSWENKWVHGDGSVRAVHHSLPTGVKTTANRSVLGLINKGFLFLHGNLGSCINYNVAKSPESPFNTEAFIWALHFLEPIWFSHFRPFHQMDVLAWWQVQKGAWSNRATVPEVKTHFSQMWKICHPYGLHQKTID